MTKGEKVTLCRFDECSEKDHIFIADAFSQFKYTLKR
jgi:hypothetical protein